MSRSDLVSFIEQQVQQNRQSRGQSPIDPTILDQGVNRAVDRHRHHHHATAAEASLPATDATTGSQETGSSGSIDLLA